MPLDTLDNSGQDIYSTSWLKKIMGNDYRCVVEKDLSMFTTERVKEGILLKLKNCPNTIIINVPFALNEDVAALAGMMPDGSLIRDLRRVYFGQLKDPGKNLLFRDLLVKLFRPNNPIFIRQGCGVYETYTNSTVLCWFLYYVLGFTKSNEEMRVPTWVFHSPKSVKSAYLREAFAMEGCILKSLHEIRFYTKPYNYATDIHDLLLALGITSHVKQRIAGTHRIIQYRVSIYRKENFQKFVEIGFTAPLHRERFNLLCQKYAINSKSF